MRDVVILGSTGSIGTQALDVIRSRRDRFRVLEWLTDAPYPRAVIEPWPDEAGELEPAAVASVEDDIWVLLSTLARTRGIQLRGRDSIFGGLPAEDGNRLYALASRVPIGAADKYDVLAAPGPVQRLAVLREAVETVTAIVRFQLSED